MLEKRFTRDAAYKEHYVQFMNEMLSSEHMIEAEQGKMAYYIPHHGILSAKKFRVVFDASAKTNLGISLNDAQLEGPNQCGHKENVQTSWINPRAMGSSTNILESQL